MFMRITFLHTHMHTYIHTWSVYLACSILLPRHHTGTRGTPREVFGSRENQCNSGRPLARQEGRKAGMEGTNRGKEEWSREVGLRGRDEEREREGEGGIYRIAVRR